MPQRQSNACLALGLLITAIVAVQLLLVHKQTAMHVPDLHPLETRQKAEANKLLQSLEDARQRLETVQADLRRQQAALATERVALERLRNATAALARTAATRRRMARAHHRVTAAYCTLPCHRATERRQPRRRLAYSRHEVIARAISK